MQLPIYRNARPQGHIQDGPRLEERTQGTGSVRVGRAWGKRSGDWCPVGTECPFGVMEFWSRMVVMAAQQRECASCHITALLTMVKMVSFVLCTFYHNKKLEKITLYDFLSRQI